VTDARKSIYWDALPALADAEDPSVYILTQAILDTAGRHWFVGTRFRLVGTDSRHWRENGWVIAMLPGDAEGVFSFTVPRKELSL
jgi:hypothetical protein